MRTLNLTPDTVLERLTRLHPKLIDLSLDRVERLLARLDDPHRKLAPVVHVAGTNGKGSVIAFMRSFLQAAGYRVHVYTSPHLVRFNERIVVAGQAIEDEELIMTLEECETANRDEPITFFEITTVAAFLAFARHDADVVLLETGLGGRLDATNLIEKPALTAITPISIDHQQFLGETVEKIAAEKAGILKANVPCVLSRQPDGAAKVIADRARALDAPLIREGRDFTAGAEGGRLVMTVTGETRRFPEPALRGAHQYQNAAQAVASLKALKGFAVDDDAISRGLQSVDWPARLQRLTAGPLVESLSADWEVWLDGGHNGGAGEALAEYAGAWSDRPLYLVFGMLNTKDPQPFLAPLRDKVEFLYAVAIPGVQAGLSAEESLKNAQALGIEAAAAESVDAALAAARERGKQHDGPARVLICGSLYLAGAVLKDNR